MTSGLPARLSPGRRAGKPTWHPDRAPSPYALLFLAASCAGYVFVRWLTQPSMLDLIVYRAEGAAVRAGLDVYGVLPGVGDYRATYPPFTALLFVPLTTIPVDVMIWATVVLNLALLVVVALLSCRLVGLTGGAQVNTGLILAGLGMWSEPVFTTFRYGQVNLLMLALILWDFTRPPERRSRGVALGLATAVKVTPAFFIVYCLLTRRLRMAVVASATFLATVAASAAALPDATWRYWTHLLFDTGRVGRPENAENQTLRGLIVRIEHTRAIGPAWTLLFVAVLVAGLALSVTAYRRLGDRWGLPACAVTALLAAPVSWTHHYVWCLPIAVLLWQEARRWVPTVVVFWTFAVWAVPHSYPHELHFSAWQVSMSLWYVAFGVCFLALTATRVRRPPPAERDGPRQTSSATTAGEEPGSRGQPRGSASQP